MIEKQITGYYCEFCKKFGRSKHAMKKHELHCTMNQNRVCRICQLKDQGPQASIRDLLRALNIQGGVDIDALHDRANGCPVCMLSAIRQSGVMKSPYGSPNYEKASRFDFKKELAAFWNEYNADQELDNYPY